jgi:dihydropteroate synthase
MLWQCRSRTLDLTHRTLIMGIVNVTPDSFSDGGRFATVDLAVQHGLQLFDEGADILDIGGESTRPGAAEVTLEEELERVIPVVELLAAQTSVPISVDTFKAEVARRAMAAGAVIINDITALSGDPEMPVVAAASGAGVVLMHMQGTPRTMQANPQYGDVVAEIRAYLAERMGAAQSAGIAADRIILDPGIGFGKTIDHNLEIFRRLGEFLELGRPILIGPSRKGFIGRLLGGAPPQERVEGTAAAVTAAIQGGARVVRVHDVGTMVRVARVADALAGLPAEMDE